MVWGEAEMSDEKPIVNNEFDVVEDGGTDTSILCPDCGARVADARRLEYHSKNCPAKTKKESTVKVAAPERSKTNPPPKKSNVTPISGDPKKQLIAQRTRAWGAALYNDVNPVINTMAKTYVGVPDEWCNGVVAQFQAPDGKVVTLWDPPLSNRLKFSEGDCDRIAKAMATFSVSPTGMFVAAWIESNAGLIALGSAGIVAAKFGWGLAKTKAEVAQLKELLAQQAKPSPGNDPNSSVKEPPASASAA
jgi:hypothetical protein